MATVWSCWLSCSILLPLTLYFPSLPRKLSDSVWVRGDVAWGQSRLVEHRRWTCTWSDRGGRVTWHFLSSQCSFVRGHAELLGCFCLKTEGTNVPACPQWETRTLMRWWSSVSHQREVSERGKVVPTSKERSAPKVFRNKPIGHQESPPKNTPPQITGREISLNWGKGVEVFWTNERLFVFCLELGVDPEICTLQWV